MKYKVTNISYYIGHEDVSDDLDEEDFALRSDYIEECDNRIAEIEESLPTEMIVDVSDDPDSFMRVFNIDLRDEIMDAISDKTGWLVNGFDYEEVAEDEMTEEKMAEMILALSETLREYIGDDSETCSCLESCGITGNTLIALHKIVEKDTKTEE